jgi:hypothetical protein
VPPVPAWHLDPADQLRRVVFRDGDLLQGRVGIDAGQAGRPLAAIADHSRNSRSMNRGSIQRFGGALNLNVHFHALVLDGVFAPDDGGRLQFHRTPRLGAHSTHRDHSVHAIVITGTTAS